MSSRPDTCGHSLNAPHPLCLLRRASVPPHRKTFGSLDLPPKADSARTELHMLRVSWGEVLARRIVSPFATSAEGNWLRVPPLSGEPSNRHGRMVQVGTRTLTRRGRPTRGRFAETPRNGHELGHAHRGSRVLCPTGEVRQSINVRMPSEKNLQLDEQSFQRETSRFIWTSGKRDLSHFSDIEPGCQFVASPDTQEVMHPSKSSRSFEDRQPVPGGIGVRSGKGVARNARIGSR